MATLNIVPPKLDLIAYGGDDTRVVFTTTDSEGAPVLLEEGTHTASIRVNANAEESYPIDVSYVDGKVLLSIPSEVTAELVVDAAEESIYIGDEYIHAPMFLGVWDWQYANGLDVRTMVYGNITIIGEVTR
jgi:hypothetical protein